MGSDTTIGYTLRAGLTAEVLDGEVLVLDTTNLAVYHLTGTQAEVVTLLARTSGPVPTALQPAADELLRLGLLQPSAPAEGIDRRRMLLTVAGVAAAGITVLALPAAAAAASGGGPVDGGGDPADPGGGPVYSDNPTMEEVATYEPYPLDGFELVKQQLRENEVYFTALRCSTDYGYYMPGGFVRPDLTDYSLKSIDPTVEASGAITGCDSQEGHGIPDGYIKIKFVVGSGYEPDSFYYAGPPGKPRYRLLLPS